MANIYLFRRKTAADWTSQNPVLMDGELGLERGTRLFKFGDGVTPWNSLPYAGASVGIVPWGAINGSLSAQTDLVAALATKQATLVSGTSIKTINGNSLLGAGDLTISGGGGGTVTLTGDVTGSGSGSFATTIAAGAVTLSKMANLAAGTFLGNNTGGPAAPIALTAAQVKTALAIAASDVSGLAAVATSGSASDLGAGTLPAARFDDTAHGNRAGGSLHANVIAGGAAGFMTGADKTKLDAITGTNTGDQTISLTGAVTGSGTGSFATSLGSFTKAQLDAAVSDGNVMYVGDPPTAHTHLLAAGATDVTITAANLNTLDDGVNTALHFHDADRARANHTGTQLAATISDFDSAARAQTEAELVAGTNITITPSGSGATRQLTIAAAGGGSPSVITGAPGADQADFNPAGFGSGVGTIKLQPTTNSFISGIAAGATDQTILLINDSAFVICILEEDSTSTAANRIAREMNQCLWLLPNETVTLRYSATLSRWARVASSWDLFAVRPNSQLILPNTGATPSASPIGVSVTPTASTIAVSATSTNDYDEAIKAQVTNSTAAGTASVRSVSLIAARGGVTGRMGFFHTGRVRFAALGATGSVRAGLTSSNAAIASLNAVITQCLLIGADAGMTNLRIFMGGASAGTPIDLGANFPVPSVTPAYEYMFYAASNGSDVQYMVRRLDSRFVAQGTMNTNIPTNTTTLGQRTEVFVGATAAANTAAFSQMIIRGL